MTLRDMALLYLLFLGIYPLSVLILLIWVNSLGDKKTDLSKKDKDNE
jgi:hypothetical protein